MKIAILGIDGYIGYSLANHLMKRGHSVYGLDSGIRRARVEEIGGDSLTPLPSIYKRGEYLYNTYGDRYLGISYRNIVNCDYNININPDTIVHLAEQPSAPYSMKDSYHAVRSQGDNVLGTLNLLWKMREKFPKAHLVKLGTMGEYGTPNCDIPEGRIPAQCLGNSGAYQCLCSMSGLLFPRTAGSFYHLSKVHDSLNIEFACRNWGLCSTDIMQGVVFGLEGENEQELTRFDYDEYFGTVINRFCVQAIAGIPLTVYGAGGQTRGYLPLKDSLHCLTIAIENPPKEGEYRTFNQFENIYTLNSLADTVVRGAKSLGIDASIEHIENPRNEEEHHYYNPDHQKLFDLGYVPTTDIQGEVTTLISKLLPYKDRIRKAVIYPKTKWR
jgi:UDP-sulfoquinovose synthase